MPDLIIIAGPNGAGKTTFANEFLGAQARPFAFVNADEVAHGLTVGPVAQSATNIRAGRIMLDRIDELVEAGADFAFETTLASLTYAHKIPLWRQRGYKVSLLYLRLPSVAHSLARVQRRARAGGHGIPEAVIRRRFDKSLAYLESIYRPLVDAWQLWDSREGDFVLLASAERQ